MRLRARPMLPKDVNSCVKLVASHPEERRRYDRLLEQLPAALLRLLRAGSTITTVVEDTNMRVPQVVACGVSVFVTTDLLRRFKTAPLIWTGPEVVRRVSSGDSSVLSPQQIREFNSAEGLNLVVWIPGISRTVLPECEDLLALEIMRSFERGHRGYRLKEFICQPVGLQAIRRTLNAGGCFWSIAEVCYVNSNSLAIANLFSDPFIIGADRELALRDLGKWLSTLFLYTPARIYFRPAEQRMLQAAMTGLTDEELADELGLSLSTIKKRWRIVYERAAGILTDELGESAIGSDDAKRGKEKKQHLLAYLREHMEELRPVLPP
jgi:hypothetical protein